MSLLRAVNLLYLPIYGSITPLALNLARPPWATGFPSYTHNLQQGHPALNLHTEGFLQIHRT